MKKAMAVLIVMVATTCLAGDPYVWEATTLLTTNYAVTVISNSPAFRGEIDEIRAYVDSGATANVAVVAIDPYDSSVTVLATNAALVTRGIWRPRFQPPATDGSSALTYTNAAVATDLPYNAQGEAIQLRLSGAGVTATNKTVKVLLKTK